jgi:hypothetical protein
MLDNSRIPFNLVFHNYLLAKGYSYSKSTCSGGDCPDDNLEAYFDVYALNAMSVCVCCEFIFVMDEYDQIGNDLAIEFLNTHFGSDWNFYKDPYGERKLEFSKL